jgi:hypothetical protein
MSNNFINFGNNNSNNNFSNNNLYQFNQIPGNNFGGQMNNQNNNLSQLDVEETRETVESNYLFNFFKI